MKSIRIRLLFWLMLGLTLSTSIAAFAVYLRARSDARDLFDYQLQLMAASFPNYGFASTTAPPPNPMDVEESLVVQIWDPSGVQVYLSRPGLPLPQSSELGFSTVATAQGNWRVYSAAMGNNLVQVAQPTKLREQRAASLALRTMLPLLIFLPVLFMVIWVTVGMGLRPLKELATAVSRRSAEALEPLPVGGVPIEARPLVNALNDLLARLGRSLSLQRSFIADAAHELRTPLAAVRLQLQVAERATTDSERGTAIAELKGGIERATRLMEQLLTLARNEPDAAEQPFAIVDLAEIARNVIAERSSIAEARHLDLGLSGDTVMLMPGDANALHVMLGNLVDNALHYTPRGGSVDVEVAAKDGQNCLVVTDTGPGIPAGERERVFDRFYRGENTGAQGSGLGLAIVRKIAQRHHASVDLGSGDDGRGLMVTACFPGK